MAKSKRKKLKNVQISTEELTPTTIGYLNTRQKGSFLLIFIFAVLFVTLYYISDITEFINKMINPALYAEMQEAKNEINEDNTGKIEELTTTTHFNISGIKFTNFVIEGDQIKFNVDDGASTGDFSGYYLETYDRSSNLLERIPIMSTTVNSLNLHNTNVKALAINHYQTGVYPNITLKDSTLTCELNDEIYKYEFVSGGVSKITYTITIKQTEDNESEYEEKLEKYNSKQSSYAEGVEKYLADNEGEFTYTEVVDLLVAGTNDLENGFPYNTKASQMAFDMSTKGYKCN